MVKTPFPFNAGGVVAPNKQYVDLYPIDVRVSLFSCVGTIRHILVAEWESCGEYAARALRFDEFQTPNFINNLTHRRDFESYSLVTNEFIDLAELLGLWSQSGSGCCPLRHYLLHPSVRSRSLFLKWRPLFMDVDGDFVKGASVRMLEYYLSPDAIPYGDEEEEEEEVEE